MHPLARVSLGLSVAVAICAVVWLVSRRDPTPTPAPRVVPCRAADDHVAAPPSPPPPEAPAPEEPLVTVGDVDLDWLPKGYVRPLDKAKTQALAEFVTAWLADQEWPHIAYRSGVVYVESEEDRGDDAPYPRSAQPESTRVCGTQALWLRGYLQHLLAIGGVVCAQNVCFLGGMEYVPNRYLVFHEENGEWYLDAWAQVFAPGLVDSIRDRNYKAVAAALGRQLTTRCAGEPTGAY